MHIVAQHKKQPAVAKPTLFQKGQAARVPKTITDRSVFFPHSIQLNGGRHNIPGATIQAKLRIGQPGDRYEQEADRIAEQVVRKMVDSSTETADVARQSKTPGAVQTKPELITPLVQRQELAPKREEEELLQPKSENTHIPMLRSQALTAQLQATQGQGRPLPAATRYRMENAFRTGLRHVRIHTSDTASLLNRSLRAQAFTHGQDIYFGAGKYQPETWEGKKLLAHELVHVGQQGRKDQISLLQLAPDKDNGDNTELDNNIKILVRGAKDFPKDHPLMPDLPAKVHGVSSTAIKVMPPTLELAEAGLGAGFTKAGGFTMIAGYVWDIISGLQKIGAAHNAGDRLRFLMGYSIAMIDIVSDKKPPLKFGDKWKAEGRNAAISYLDKMSTDERNSILFSFKNSVESKKGRKEIVNSIWKNIVKTFIDSSYQDEKYLYKNAQHLINQTYVQDWINEVKVP